MTTIDNRFFVRKVLGTGMYFSISDNDTSSIFQVKINELLAKEDSILNLRNKRIHSTQLIDMKKEKLYLTAIRNLLKKLDFLQLVIQLTEGAITEKVFNSEIKKNPKKYIIDTNYLDNTKDMLVIGTIMELIDIERPADEIAEMFSVEYNSYNKNLNTLSHSF